MYTENYGYRSGINPAMASHLHGLARYGQIESDLWLDDVVLDIGGNDGTLLQYFGSDTPRLLIDPIAGKWNGDGIKRLAETFDVPAFYKLSPLRKAQLIFSVAMFYDLENPVQFARDISRCLASDGVWILEQSYLPAMVTNNAFDTICHEHLEYYTLPALESIMRRSGLCIQGVDFNDSNGGSVRLAVRGKPRTKPPHIPDWGWHAPSMFGGMVGELALIKKELYRELSGNVVGWGASTKGNTLLQHFGITKEQIPYIVDANPEKWGRVTPGTNIPIVAAPSGPVDAYLVLPWHFRRFVIEKEREFLRTGGKLIFPLPEVEVVTWDMLSGRG